jgi:hypothetical protein
MKSKQFSDQDPIGFDRFQVKIRERQMFSTRKGSDDLSAIVSASFERSQDHAKEVTELSDFFNNLRHLLNPECLRFLPRLDQLGQIFKMILETESRCVQAEERLAEDLNDIAVRSAVLSRNFEEVQASQKQLKSSRDALERAQRDLDADAARGGARQVRLQHDLEQAKTAKRAALQATVVKLGAFINAKKRFNAMKTRRIRHGFTNLGEVYRVEMAMQGQKCGELVAAIGSERDVIEVLLTGQTVAECEESLGCRSSPAPPRADSDQYPTLPDGQLPLPVIE